MKLLRTVGFNLLFSLLFEGFFANFSSRLLTFRTKNLFKKSELRRLSKSLFLFLLFLCHQILRFKYQIILLLIVSSVSPKFTNKAIVMETEDTVVCPDKYALEISPGKYIRCEDYDLYFDSGEDQKYVMSLGSKEDK